MGIQASHDRRRDGAPAAMCNLSAEHSVHGAGDGERGVEADGEWGDAATVGNRFGVRGSKAFVYRRNGLPVEPGVHLWIHELDGAHRAVERERRGGEHAAYGKLAGKVTKEVGDVPPGGPVRHGEKWIERWRL